MQGAAQYQKDLYYSCSSIYVVYIAGKKKGQSKYTPCSGEWTEAKLDGYKR